MVHPRRAQRVDPGHEQLDQRGQLNTLNPFGCALPTAPTVTELSLTNKLFIETTHFRLKVIFWTEIVQHHMSCKLQKSGLTDTAADTVYAASVTFW